MIEVAENHQRDRLAPSFPRARRPMASLAGPLLLLVFYIGFFWKLTLTRQYTWLDSPDYADQVLPWYQFEASEIQHGRFPLWDPHEWGGQPLLGQMQPGLSYPLNWLLFLLPFHNGWLQQTYLHWYFVLLHYMAGLFCFWLCRDLQRSFLASILAGVAFGIGGFVGNTDWPMMLNGAVWAPLVAMFCLRALRGLPPLRNAAFAGACLGMAFLSGHHQVPVFITLMAGGLWIYHLARSRRRGEFPSGIATVAVFGLFLFLVSAFITLPAWEYGELAIRWVGSSHPVGWNDAVPYWVHADNSLFPFVLLGIVVPGIAVHSVAYMGWVALTLACIGLLGAWRDREVRVLGAIALGALIFSLSQFGLLHGLLYALVPLVEKARSPHMAVVLFHFALAVLAAYGLDTFAAPAFRSSVWPKRLITVLLCVAATFAVLVLVVTSSLVKRTMDFDLVMISVIGAFSTVMLLYGWRVERFSRRTAGILLLLLMLFELGNVTGWGYRSREEPDNLLAKLALNSDIVQFLAKRPGPIRLEIDDQIIPYNFGDWYGIDVFGGYLASLTTAIADTQGTYWARMLFGTNYWVGTKPLREGQIEVFTASSGLKVYSNPEAFPRIWTVHHIVGIRQDEVDRKLGAGGTALRREAFIIGKPPKVDVCSGSDVVGSRFRESNFVRVDVTMECAGMLVLGETWFPGWSARIDGQPATIWPAYYALRGVVVPAGRHRIEMVYHPRSVLIGGLMSLAGLSGVLALAVLGRRA